MQVSCQEVIHEDQYRFHADNAATRVLSLVAPWNVLNLNPGNYPCVPRRLPLALVKCQHLLTLYESALASQRA